MPELTTADGTTLYWDALGEGPPVVIPAYLLGIAGSLQPFVDEISRDHRVVWFDGRGTGLSSRVGPFDMETGTADLEAVVELTCEEPAVVIGMADACNRAVRLASARPELVLAVVAPGAAPMNRAALREVDAMAGSDSVIAALLDTIEHYYASALRNMVGSTNPQLSEDELKQRIELIAEHVPQEVAVARMRTWIADDPEEAANAIGERLIVLASDNVVRPWWPSEEDLVRLVAERLPQARIEHVEDGLVSRPDQAAAIVRSLTKRSGVPAGKREA